MTSVMPQSPSAQTAFAAAVGGVPFLRALSPADLERLRPAVQCRRVDRNSWIWQEHDPNTEFVFLAEGRAKLVKGTDAGRDVILDVCGPGQLLCSGAVADRAPYCCSCAPLEDGTMVFAVPRRDLLDLLESSSSASMAFLREVTTRGMLLSVRIAQLSSGQVERRIAALFQRLADQLGSPREGGGTWIPVTLSRQDLADLCGTTLETTIRTTSRLARQGVLKSVGRGFVVLDRERLDAIARGAAE
jgi:CRP/FNR family transcriptional regulator